LRSRTGCTTSWPIGTLFVAASESQLELLPDMDGERLDREGVLRAEPALAPTVAGGLLVSGGRRSDPSALTLAAAELARQAGAEVRCNEEVRRLTEGAVLTDRGTERAGTIVVAAGAWTRQLAAQAGHDVPVRPVRGWLAVTAPVEPVLHHVVYEPDYTAPAGPQPGESVTLADLGAGALATEGPRAALAMAAHQNRDGSIMVGASRSPALREGDESAGALREIAMRACRMLPALAACEVATTWSGLRPFSSDGLPYIGRLDTWLVVCAGHGSEGILTGAGSGRLAAELALGAEPFADPVAFSPARA
jgi:glycine/D-amino acid oxidase-like deaminating enzyme